MKGGIWKNTEDEILKAAVMKYGINQWARVSSLLVRKSARDCKARWFEWLDPSIRKTEWSREEEEKLLNLAKVMPHQWRSIAPLVGRTAMQCLEHYERLLDQAANQGKFDDLDEGYRPPSSDPLDDPRRLRPGEIDPHPETKPARPDPIDMDEDEKEMLQEARARLANTRGKKAKRKAREKQLEEAKRLASLQKRRELRAAGISVGVRTKKKDGINYNEEIPFYQKPLAGYYDPDDDLKYAPKPSFDGPVSLQKLEGPRRDDEEEKQRKIDIEKRKKKEATNMPDAIMQLARLSDPTSKIRVTAKLNLPAPQISDQELEEIVRLSKLSVSRASGSRNNDDEDDEDFAPTSSLLGDYSSKTVYLTPSISRQTGGHRVGESTPARILLTPGALNLNRSAARTPSRPDALMLEAQNQAAQAFSRTSVLGGEVPDLPNSDMIDSNFSVEVSSQHSQTPNPLLMQMTPSRAMHSTPSASQIRGGTGSSVDARTPLRDQLHINQGSFLEPSLSLRPSSSLKSQLLSLPQPKNQYQIALPDEEPAVSDSNQDNVLSIEDASDRDARTQEQIEEQKRQLWKQRSTVLQRKDLPRSNLDLDELVKRHNSIHQQSSQKTAASDAQYQDLARLLVQKEAINVIFYDSVHYPLQSQSRDDPEKFIPLIGTHEIFSEQQLAASKDLIDQELRDKKNASDSESSEMKAASSHLVDPEQISAFEESWTKLHSPSNIFYSPQNDRFELLSSATSSHQRLESLVQYFGHLLQQLQTDQQKNDKLMQKVSLYNGGYQKRASKLQSDLSHNYEELQSSTEEITGIKRLQSLEQTALKTRFEFLQQAVAVQRQRERELQSRYAEIASTVKNLEHQIQLKFHSAIPESSS